MCPVNDAIEDTEHFLLLCNSFTENRRNLLAGVNDVSEAYEYSNTLDVNILQFLLYGSKYLPSKANKLILNFTITCISETKGFGGIPVSIGIASNSLIFVSYG